jgi:hypothetical protein
MDGRLRGAGFVVTLLITSGEELFDAALQTVWNGLGQRDLKDFKTLQNHYEMVANKKGARSDS